MATYKGRWHGAPFRDYKNKKYYITVELDRAPGVYDSTQGKDIAVTIEPWAELRSNAANRYMHELLGQIAKILYISMTEIKNMMLAEYGQPDTEADDVMMLYEKDWRKQNMHLRPRPGETVTGADGELYQIYEVMRGSHTYNTREMVQLIDGIIYEAKGLGIETRPPEEIERLKEGWQKK